MSRAKQQAEVDQANREEQLAGEEGRETAAAVSGDSTVGAFPNAGLTDEESARLEESRTVSDSRLKTSVDDAVTRIRVYTSHLDDLVHRYDKGLPVTRTHIGDLKTHLDAIVQDLVNASEIA